MSTGDEILLLRGSEYGLPSLLVGTNAKTICGATDQREQQQFGVAFDALEDLWVSETDVFESGIHVRGPLPIDQPGQGETVDEALQLTRRHRFLLQIDQMQSDATFLEEALGGAGCGRILHAEDLNR